MQSKITSKGQVTLPAALRERLGLRPGDVIEFVEQDGRVFLRKHFDESPFDKWVGFLKHLEGQDPDQLLEEWRGRRLRQRTPTSSSIS